MLIIANAEIAGARVDIRIARGLVAEIGHGLSGAPVLEAAGGALIPGLHDHHIHLLALAASLGSVDVSPEAVSGAAELKAALSRAPGPWMRATGYHDSVAGPLDRDALDRLEPHRPVRVQYATGSLWVLNSAALRLVLPPGEPPSCVERGEDGAPTGRIWRGDVWLRSRLPAAPPDLGPVGRLLASCGITGVTDTSATTGEAEAAIFSRAVRSGALPQRLMLMSGGALDAADEYRVGPVKILLDDHDLPDLDDLAARIRQARRWDRAVAVHCVTAVELAIILAAFHMEGALPGDRIEHGGIIPAEAIPELRRLGLTVVTQPGFIAERGDRYLREVDELPDLYRCASLMRAGVPVAGSTDAPYTSPDPWAAIQAAMDRRTRSGHVIGAGEALAPEAALDLFLGAAERPAVPRRIVVGMPADLCLLGLPLREALARPDARNVVATVVGGHLVHRSHSLSEPQETAGVLP
ncbi:MAG: amidohydrolase family protein [Sphingomonadales bacterium]